MNIKWVGSEVSNSKARILSIEQDYTCHEIRT